MNAGMVEHVLSMLPIENNVDEHGTHFLKLVDQWSAGRHVVFEKGGMPALLRIIRKYARECADDRSGQIHIAAMDITLEIIDGVMESDYPGARKDAADRGVVAIMFDIMRDRGHIVGYVNTCLRVIRRSMEFVDVLGTIRHAYVALGSAIISLPDDRRYVSGVEAGVAILLHTLKTTSTVGDPIEAARACGIDSMIAGLRREYAREAGVTSMLGEISAILASRRRGRSGELQR